jgi:hypothetical protein
VLVRDLDPRTHQGGDDVVLEAVKVWPGDGGAGRTIRATANLDSFCARQRKRSAGRGEEAASDRTKKLTKEKMRRPIAYFKRLLDKAHTRKPRLGNGEGCRRSYGDLRAAGVVGCLGSSGPSQGDGRTCRVFDTSRDG